ncbi:putative Rho-type GTPase-activating protein 2 [Colletotrichum tanaceti]|uniref:Putative Rho-type GTPase-activating protein 2 n=1 Tax=Colletotrichum tanaceti TaxID=1306861 RepID=A0A4U6XNA7_9PEZI|nr:putative Rho-type GTPase-activating protein 2 [Colletotrichum tanaceti]TKW57198.1 putative Rho-type GTPase-activating protein 2 [Colletotrichum tanaceti]
MSQLALQAHSAQGSTSDSDASGSVSSTSGQPAVTTSADAPVVAAAPGSLGFPGSPGAHHPRLPHQKHPLHRLQVSVDSFHAPPSFKDGPTTGLLIPVSDPASASISTTAAANTSTAAAAATATAASHCSSPSSTTSPLLTPSPRSPRRPIPRPLHETTAVTSPTSPFSPRSSSFFPPIGNFYAHRARTVPDIVTTPTDNLRSPVSLSGESQTHYQSDSSTSSISGRSARRPRISLLPTNDNRSASEPVLTSRPPVGSLRYPMSTSGGSAAAARARPAKGAPRNSSMDSAISAISTKSQSQRGTTGSQSDPTDIAALIKTAGSPEAVIQYLLKEKHSQSQQNAQLWRLVDKQRAMILGLNKDLERALKDKEKYRKKLKEVISIPETTGADSAKPASKVLKMPVSRGIPTVDVSAPTERQVEPPDSPTLDSDSQKHSPVEMAMAPYPITPPADQPNGHPSAVGALLDPSHEMPKAHEHAYDRFNHDAEEHAAELAQRDLEADDMMDLPNNMGLPPSRSLPSQPPSMPPPKPPGAPESAPAADEGLSQFPAPPPRKPPPAPLQLLQGQTHPSREEEDSESDFDDLLEVNEVLTDRRGRRRTREEDDHDREILAMQEAERRSLSKKSQTDTPHSIMDAPTQLPPSPPKRMHRENVPASLAGVLSAGNLEAPLPSPGLPSSPRPQGAPSPDSSLISVPPFPAAPLSPRPPRQPIPLPPGHSLQMPAEPMELKSPQPLNIVKKAWDSASDKSRGSPTERGRIFKGFVTDEHPDLLLSPNVLPTIRVQVASSRMKPSRASLMSLTQLEEDPVFTLAVFSRSEPGELWRVEKDSASLAKLDQRLKQCSAFTAKTPERSLFSGHAPAKLDARRIALDHYLEELLETPLDTASALELCKYLSTHTLPPNADDAGSMESMVEAKAKLGPGGRPFRTGYLTKRGKNFGGWKARFFVLDGPHLKYYETPGGAHLGTIKLPSAQIGKQSQSNENQSPQQSANSDDMDNQYRHAFLILEPKKKDSSSHVKHVLCAENDRERDQWVDALLRWIDYKDPEEDEGRNAKHHAQDRHSSGATERADKKKQQRYKKTVSHHQPSESDSLIGVRYDAMSQGDLPHHGGPARPRTAGQMPENLHAAEAMNTSSQPSMMISAPRDMQVIADSSQWGNRSGLGVPVNEEKKMKKRSFFGFGPKTRSSSDGQDSLFGGSEGGSSTPPQGGYQGPIRQAFGAPLAEAVRYNHPVDVNVPLPAVVYRCIQYLDAKNAILEEGIFRLSGSNVVIKQLRERFNTEGDVNLVTDETYFDIHAVASLLKLYLRELPTTILTRDLHLHFLAVTELSSQTEKIAAVSELVQRLPQANATLLKYLIAFLIKIINNADMNKMTVRNVGIVFSPTLNIPAPVFAMLLQNYFGIFGLEPEEYELPSTLAEEDTGRERSGSLPSMSNGVPTRPSYEPAHQTRPSTSTGSSQSPHRQRLLEAMTGQQRSSGTPPPLLQDLQSARSSPTPPPNYPVSRSTVYEPQYAPQGYHSNGYLGTARGYDSGGSSGYDQQKRRESAIFMGNVIGLNSQSSKSRLREETQF